MTAGDAPSDAAHRTILLVDDHELVRAGVRSLYGELHGVPLRWIEASSLQEPTDGVIVGFDVLRTDVSNPAAGAVTLTAQPLPATATGYTDTTAVTGSLYQYQVVAQGTGNVAVDYRVVAVNAAGETPSPVTTLQLGQASSSATSALSATATTPMVAPTRVALDLVPGATVAATFSWTPVQNAANYMVRTRIGTTANNGAFSAWTPVATTSYTVNAPNNNWVTFEVQAASPAQVLSATLSSGAAQMATPLVPNGLALSAATTSSLTLAWNLRANASSYVVEYATNAAFTTGLVTVPGVTTNSYTANGLAPNTRYYFRVRSVNALGTSGNSTTSNSWTLANSVVLAPLVLANATGTSVGLSWTASVGGASSYQVQRSADGGATWATAATTATTTATVNGLLGLSDYQFRVVARNGANVVAAPSPVRAVSTPLAAPSAVTAANGTNGGIVTAGLNFTGNNSAAARYEVRFRSVVGPVLWVGPIVAIPSEQIAVGGAARGVYMQVRAVNNASGAATAWGPGVNGVTVQAR